jgi:hypothetical protein
VPRGRLERASSCGSIQRQVSRPTKLVGMVVTEHPRERQVDEQGDPVALDVQALDRLSIRVR